MSHRKRRGHRRGSPYDRSVLNTLTLIAQFGINMLVPIFIMSALGIYLDRRFGTSFIMIILFFVGAVAGAQNVYRMAKRVTKIGEKKEEERKPRKSNVDTGEAKKEE